MSYQSNDRLNQQDSLILVVDDIVENLDVLRNVLEQQGYRVAVTSSGRMALRIVNRVNPDLILLDVMMPEMDGMEVCRRLKQTPKTSHIPIIFVTAKDDIENIVQGFQLGAVDYIRKPFQVEEICARVDTQVKVKKLLEEQKRLIMGLRSSEEQFNLISAYSPTAVFHADKDGCIVYTNERWRKIFNLSVEDSLGFGWIELVHPDDINMAKQFMKKGEATFRIIVNNEERILQGQTKTVQGPEGQTCYVGSINDITEDVNKEQQKQRFVSMLVHELRSPLSSMINYGELLLEEAEEKGDKELIHDIQAICTIGSHLRSLINNTLDMSKVQEQKVTISYHSVKVSNLVQEIQTIVLPLMDTNKNQLKIEYQADAENMSITTDIIKLKQILLNLLSNAAKFTKQGEVRLAIAIASKLNYIMLAVSDEGVGISDEELEKIFKPYEQSKDTVTRMYGGTGLGLVVSRDFCKMLGGNLVVNNHRQKGVEFIVQLPLDRKMDMGLVEQSETAKIHSSLDASSRSTSYH